MANSQCTFRQIADVYSYSITDLSDGNFAIFYQKLFSYDLEYEVFDDDGNSLKRGILYTFSTLSEASVSAAGLPDGRIVICYKEDIFALPLFEFRDLDLTLVSGPFQASSSAEDSCYRTILVGASNFIFNFENANYVSFDYFVNSTLKISSKNWLPETNNPILRGDKTEIYFITATGLLSKASAKANSIDSFISYTFVSAGTSEINFHISEKINQVYFTALEPTGLIVFHTLSQSIDKYQSDLKIDLFKAPEFASAYRPPGFILICGIEFDNVICSGIDENYIASTSNFLSPEWLHNISMRSLPSGRFVFLGTSNSNTLHFIVLGSDGTCTDPILARNITCAQPDWKCLNLDEISFFLGCKNGLYSFNSTCVGSCPNGFVANNVNFSCELSGSGYYEDKLLQLYFECPHKCLSCSFEWNGTDHVCLLETTFISNYLRGKMGSRATGQILIPFLNLRSLHLARLSSYTREVKINQLDTVSCFNPVGSAYASLDDGIFAVLVDCYDEHVISIYDSNSEFLCSLGFNYETFMGSNPEFFATDDSFIFLGKTGNSLDVISISVEKNYTCSTYSLGKLQPFDPLNVISSYSIAHLSKKAKFAIVWTEINQPNSIYQVILAITDLKGNLTQPYIVVKKKDNLFTNSTKVSEIYDFGIVVVWTTEDSNSVYSISKQMFNYEGFNTSDISQVAAGVTINPPIPDVIPLRNGNYIIGWIECSQGLEITCGIALRLFKPEVSSPIISKFTNVDYLRFSTLNMLNLPDDGFIVTWSGIDGVTYAGEKLITNIVSTFALRYDSTCQEIRNFVSKVDTFPVCEGEECNLEIFIVPESIFDSDCSGTNLAFCDSLTALLSNIEGKSATIYFLKSYDYSHFILTKEIDDLGLFRYDTADSFTLWDLTLKPLFCDDGIISNFSQLNQNCSQRDEILDIYFKSPLTIRTDNLEIKNLRLLGNENLGWMNADRVENFSSSNCLYLRKFCCSPSSSGINCKSGIDLSKIPMTLKTRSIFEIRKMLNVDNSSFDSFLQPSIDSLFFVDAANSQIQISNSAFLSNKFKIGLFYILKSANFRGVNISFRNYNPWSLKNSSSVEYNEPEGYFILADMIEVLEISDSFFSNATFQNPGCGVMNNFYLRNFTLYISVVSTDLIKKFLGVPIPTSSLINIKMINKLSFTNNEFRNIIGLAGSVLNIESLREEMKISDNLFDSNFATRAFSNILIRGILNSFVPILFENNEVFDSLSCLDAFGNIILSGDAQISVIANNFSRNYLPLSNSIVTSNSYSLELRLNRFEENGGILFDLWYFKIISSFFAADFKISNLTSNLAIFQSTCVYFRMTLYISTENNSFIDNFGSNENSQYLANSITFALVSYASEITMLKDYYKHNFTHFTKHRQVILQSSTSPQISLTYDLYDYYISLVISDIVFEDSIFNSQYDTQIYFRYQSSFLSILSSEAFWETENLEIDVPIPYPDYFFNLTILNGVFRRLGCPNCTSLLFKANLVTSFDIKNCTFENIDGIQLLNFIPDFYFLRLLKISYSSFSNIRGNKISILSTYSLDFRIENSIFNNVIVYDNYFLEINAEKSSNTNISLINCSSFLDSTMQNIHLRNVSIFNFLKGGTVNFWKFIGINSTISDSLISLNFTKDPSTLFEISATMNFHFIGSSIEVRSQVVFSSLFHIESMMILITKNIFKTMITPPTITLFEFIQKSSVIFLQNLFFDPSAIFTSRSDIAFVTFSNNVFFFFPQNPILKFEFESQSEVIICDNIFLQSATANSYSIESLISVSDQKFTSKICRNVFLNVKTTQAVIRVVSNLVFYATEIQNNIFINNQGSQIYLFASNRISSSSIYPIPTAKIQNNTFSKGYARLAGSNPGFGGAIQIFAKDQVLQSTLIGGNSFISNKADVKGGAIYANWNLPNFSNDNKFFFNFAQRENNIYTYPVHLSLIPENKINYLVSTTAKLAVFSGPEYHQWNSVAPGIEFKDTYKFALLDHFGQICYDDSYSILTLNPEGINSSEISAFTSQISVRAVEGIYTLKSLKLFYPVGLNKTIYFNSSAIETVFDYYIKTLVDFRLCKAGEYVNAADQTCIECGTGFYLPLLSDNRQGPCIQCDQTKMICLGGSNFGLLPGHWILQDSSDIIVSCPIAKACIGSVSPYDVEGTLTMKTNCSTGYRGNLCWNCNIGYGKSSPNSGCLNCANDVLYYLRIGAGFVFSLIFFIYGVKKAINESFGQKESFNKEMSIRMRIMLNYLQMISLVGNIKISWSSSFSSIFSLLSELGNVMQSTVNVDCFLNSGELSLSLQIIKFILTQLSVFGYIFIGIMFWMVYHKFKKKTERSDTTKKIIVTVIIILYNSLPQLILSSLSMFRCVNLHRKNNPIYFWKLDYDLECYHGDHLKYGVGFNMPFLILWAIVIPMWSFKKLKQNKNNLENKDFQQMYSFLYEGYKPEYFYWELLQLGKKLIFILAVTFISLVSEFLQFFVLHALALVFLGIHVWKQPYIDEKFNQMEKFSIISCIFWGLLALLLSNTSENNYGVTETFLIVVGLTGALSFLVFWIWKYGSEIFKRRKIKIKQSRRIILNSNTKEAKFIDQNQTNEAEQHQITDSGKSLVEEKNQGNFIDIEDTKISKFDNINDSTIRSFAENINKEQMDTAYHFQIHEISESLGEIKKTQMDEGFNDQLFKSDASYHI